MKTGATGWRQQYVNEGFACLNGESGRAESCKRKMKCDQVLMQECIALYRDRSPFDAKTVAPWWPFDRITKLLLRWPHFRGPELPAWQNLI